MHNPDSPNGMCVDYQNSILVGFSTRYLEAACPWRFVSQISIMLSSERYVVDIIDWRFIQCLRSSSLQYVPDMASLHAFQVDYTFLPILPFFAISVDKFFVHRTM